MVALFKLRSRILANYHHLIVGEVINAVSIVSFRLKIRYFIHTFCLKNVNILSYYTL
jgi:hypothetical protein